MDAGVQAAIVATISAATSIAVALVGAWVAKRKGLPAINQEIESRNGALIRALRGQVEGVQAELADAQADFAQCKVRLERALDENAELRRRVSLAEGDLLALYRQAGTRPPPHLRRPEEV